MPATTEACIYMDTDMCVDMCIDMHIDICTDVFIDMCMDMYKMCTEMCMPARTVLSFSSPSVAVFDAASAYGQICA